VVRDECGRHGRDGGVIAHQNRLRGPLAAIVIIVNKGKECFLLFSRAKQCVKLLTYYWVSIMRAGTI